MSGFGFAHIKGEGAPIHPDDVDYDWPDHGIYMDQAKAYYDHYGLADEWVEFKEHWETIKGG